MNILSLDLASRTGFATEISGRRASGYKDFTPMAGEGRGWRYIRFNVWLYSWKAHPFDLVVVERALPHHSSMQSAEIAFGLSTRVIEFCERQRVKLVSVNNATLKKYFCGNGRAEKYEMIRAAQTIDPNIRDDNEADAVLLLQYTKLVTLKGTKR